VTPPRAPSYRLGCNGLFARIAGAAAAALLAAHLAGCERKGPEQKPAGPAPTNVTVAPAEVRDIEVREETVGTVEGVINPVINAEVAGVVTRVIGRAGDAVKAGDTLAIIDPTDLRLQREVAQAEVARLDAELAKQNRVVERTQQLVKQRFVSEAALDDALSLQKSLREQLEGARASKSLIDRSIGKTRVSAPIDGRIDKPIVAPGEYVKVGDPLFQLVSSRVLNVYLPFPEASRARLRPGQPVRLTTPSAPDRPIEAQLAEIKPVVGDVNRAVNVIVRLKGFDAWSPGATVNGSVLVEVRKGVVAVPEISVVLRPAGKVVYVVQDGKAVQKLVTTGVKQGGMIEIVSGLSAGEQVVVDGAGFLTDQAPVRALASK
jgi:RND family efflux transporter MFP subunit